MRISVALGDKTILNKSLRTRNTFWETPNDEWRLRVDTVPVLSWKNDGKQL